MDAEQQRHRRRRLAVAAWLFVVLAMVFAMVVLGGVTRLNHAGLSMVDWKPISGWLPPGSEAEWRQAFAAYRRFPEYRELNLGMTLAEFRSIFQLEFLHRLWGRLLGVVFLLPFLAFAAWGWIGRRLGARLVAVFVLGAAQGGLGWFMVKSGLVDAPDVSQYRLAAHLGLALILFAWLLWLALEQLRPEPAGPGSRLARGAALAVAGLVFVTALSGAFMAGLDAGFTYNTFPLMDGELVPEGLLSMQPAWVNPFENITTVQFDHRLLAMAVVVAALVGWLTARRAAAPRRRLAAGALLAMVLVQAGLGIATLLLVVPVTLAAVHQAGALVVFGLALWTAFEVRPEAAPSPG